MESESLMLLVAVALIGSGLLLWSRRRAKAAADARSVVRKTPRDKRRGPRRLNSRREGFRMGKDDNERRSDKDRRQRKPGWDNDPGNR